MPSYVNDSDLEQMGLPGKTLGGLSIEDRGSLLSAASDLASGYFKAQFTMPLLVWGDDLRSAIVDIASWKIMKRRGFNPEVGADIAIRQGYEDAISWLEDVAKGKVIPEITDSATTSAASSPAVSSATSRGW